MERASLPNGPGTPAVLQTLQWSVKPFAFLDACRSRFGDFFTVRIIGNRTYVLTSDLALIRDIFAGLGGTSLGIGNEELRPMLGDNSLFLLNGSKHAHHRKMLFAPFWASMLSSYSSRIADTAWQAVASWGQSLTLPVYPAMQEITIGTIIGVMFGYQSGDRFEHLKRSILQFMGHVNGMMVYFPALQKDLGNLSPGGRLCRAKAALEQLLEAEIKLARESVTADSSILHSLVRRGEEGDDPFTISELVDELKTVVLAGHDPTTAVLSWCLYRILSNPPVLRRLNDEIRAIPDSDIERVHLLPYLDSVCNEVMRINPTIPAVERTVVTPVELRGYRIAAGVRLAPCMYLVHHSPDIYPDPEKFLPERFLERKYASNEFFPFGGGTRRCIGSFFAPHQIKIVLAVLLKSFDFEPVKNDAVQPVQRGAVIGPSSSFRIRIAKSLRN